MPIAVNVSVGGCLSLYDSPVMNWQLGICCQCQLNFFSPGLVVDHLSNNDHLFLLLINKERGLNTFLMVVYSIFPSKLH